MTTNDITVTAITIPYAPRSLQAEIHANLDNHRWAVLVLHRRAGKTVLLLNQLLKRAMQNDQLRPRYAYIAPFLKQAKTLAWDYLKYYCDPIPGRIFSESELKVELPNGAQIRLYGADNPDSLRGIYLDGCVLDEYAQIDPVLFSSIIRPALSDRKGWCVFSGTPSGKNHFYDVMQTAKELGANGGWYFVTAPASQTGIVDPEELEDARRTMTEEEFDREYECNFENSVVGSYYGALMNQADNEERIANVPYDPMLQVTTAWDLGMGDSTAIWFFQIYNKEVRVIDYFEASGEGMAYYAKELSAKPYTYNQHIMPHDISVRELGTGKSRYETALSLGIKPIQVAKKLPVDDGIQAVRSILPRCWFDKKRCKNGINALQEYHKEYDDIRKEYKSKPFHDWTSHAADAFRMFAVGYQEPVKVKPVSSILIGHNYSGVW